MSDSQPSRIEVESGQTTDELFARLYGELKRMAVGRFRLESRDSLQVTALVHEAYLRMHGRPNLFPGAGAFSVFACKAMRSVLVDHARARQTVKRQGAVQRVLLDDLEESYSRDGFSLLELDDALRMLEEVQPQCARVVELRYFGGLSVVETAQALAVCEDTVRKHWRSAGSWLAYRLGREDLLRESSR